MQHAAIGQRAAVLAPAAFPAPPRAQDQNRGKDDDKTKYQQHG
jgi:hypothetical protein